jgi:hypothetical protein
MKATARICVVLTASTLVACSQLPNRAAISVDKQPTFEGTYIAYNPEILGNNLANYVGSVCVPKQQDKCGPRDWAPGRYLADGQAAVVRPAQANSSPSFRSLVSANYSVDANFPFIKPAANVDSLNEVEMRTVAVASTADPDKAFPGADALRLRLRANGVFADRVYWINSTSLSGLSNRSFSKVNSTLGVTGTGFGFGGKTYNGNETAEYLLLMGLDIREIDLRSGLQPGAAPAPAPLQRIPVDGEGRATFDLNRAVGRSNR